MNKNFNLSISHAPLRQLVIAWLALVVAFLGAAVLSSLVVLSARLPYFGKWLQGNDLVQIASVLHVNWMVTLGFAAFAGVLWSLLGGTRWLAVMWLAFWLCALGALVMGVSPFLGAATPLPNGYLPMLDSPYYFIGLGSFAFGFVLMLGRTLMVGLSKGSSRETPEYAGWAAYAAALASLIALGTMFWSGMSLPGGAPRADLLAAMSWSFGHVIQFSYLLLMLTVWLWFAQQGGWELRLGSSSVTAMLGLAILPVLGVPMLYMMYGSAGEMLNLAFSHLMAYGSWLAIFPLGLVMFLALLKNPKGTADNRFAHGFLLFSLALVLLGAFSGVAIRQGGAMVSAHFHAMLGAVMLSFMALAIDVLPRLGLLHPDNGLVRRLPSMFGSGIAMLAAGFAWAGVLGVPRKLAGAPHLGSLSQEMGIAGLTGIGGGLVIVAIIVFLLLVLQGAGVVSSGMNLRTRTTAPGPDEKWSGRILGHALSISLVVAASILFARMPLSQGDSSALVAKVRIDPRVNPSAHEIQAKEMEIRARFEQAVTMLHAKKYDFAVAALHRVLALSPRLPEGHVNMGYAMLGMERYEAARDFFSTAIELRPMQANAYYGLAIALEKLHDLPGAIGAMRTFLHLAPPDDPFVRKAQGAMWEWESALGRNPQLNAPPSVPAERKGSASVSGNTNPAVRVPNH